MSGDDDWADEYAEDKPTRVDQPPLDDAVPEPIPERSPETTGRYGTLRGYEVSQEIRRGEREIGHREVYAGFKLAQIKSGTHPDVAHENAERLRIWCERNWDLIRVTIGR